MGQIVNHVVTDVNKNLHSVNTDEEKYFVVEKWREIRES